jgi:hypothetical protein
MRPVACAKCGTCGIWKPKREMIVGMTSQTFYTPERGFVRDNPENYYECRSHTPKQIRRSRDRFIEAMREVYR